MFTSLSLHNVTLREAAKKVLFLVAWPLTPPPHTKVHLLKTNTRLFPLNPFKFLFQAIFYHTNYKISTLYQIKVLSRRPKRNEMTKVSELKNVYALCSLHSFSVVESYNLGRILI